MKRVSLSIKTKSHPNTLCLGYALTTELTDNLCTFFSTQKFPIDEELEITTHLNGETQVFHVILRTLREEISSGKIMNALPDEDHPFPARTFYKCYAKRKIVEKSVETEEPKAA